ncbi:hypothetical protein MERGE_002597, partial [Pneumocystis wakefieldiae]
MFYPVIYKIIAIGVFNLVAFTYGNKDVDLIAGISQVSSMGALFENIGISQQDIYAFIFKDYEEDKCKKILGKICNELKKIAPSLGNG